MVVACGSDPITAVDLVDAGSDAGPVGTKDGGAKTDAGDGGTPVATFSIGGSVSGLLGTGLVLQDNAGDDLPIAANGTFAFSKKLASKAAFAITIKTQPTAPSQACTLSGASGTVAAGNVTSVVVNCSTDTFTVGGTVTGLVGTGLTIKNNGGDALIVNANGTFASATPVASGAPYAVTVDAQPGTPSQTCTVAAGTGNVAAANVTDVAIACTTNEYTVGGNVTGLTGAGLMLQINGGDSLPIAADGAFTFATPIASGADFTVTVSAQPTAPAQTCLVTGDTGTIGSGNITSVVVNCATDKFTVGGTASGLLGNVVLQDNGGDNLTLNGDGAFAFTTPLEDLAAYAVTVLTQPGTPSQTCTLASASGNVAAAPVTSVVLTCVTNTFKVKGNVSGLSGAGLILKDNNGDNLTVAASGAFEFGTAVASGQTYAVTVSAQPTLPSQSCTVTNANGTIGAADVTNVTVTCVTNKYTVGGSVAGLSGGGLMLQNNNGDALAVAPGAGSFTFPTSILSGAGYNVTVKTQPSNPTQTCSVAAGTGTVTNGNVVTVMVNCTTNQYAIGGTTTGLAGTGLVLQDNNGGDLTVNGNGAFAFAAPIASGATYSVTVKTQPTNKSQTCTVTNGSGTVGGAAVSTVAVACVTNELTIGGTITGLAGTIVLQDNGGDDLSRTTDGAFVFTAAITSGAAYAVTVKTPPVGSFCTVTSGTGTVGASNIANVVVTCQTALVIKVEGHADVPVPCVAGDYSCEAHYVCNGVTNTECVFQTYDCGTGSQGSWYPPVAGAGDENFNFAFSYDFSFGDYGNICACDTSFNVTYGLASNHEYCGTGHWFRQ